MCWFETIKRNCLSLTIYPEGEEQSQRGLHMEVVGVV